MNMNWSDLLNLGTVGGALFFLSWLVQGYETKRKNKSTVSLNFWLIRLVGVLILIVYSYQIGSTIFVLMYLVTGIIVIFNIVVKEKEVKNGM